MRRALLVALLVALPAASAGAASAPQAWPGQTIAYRDLTGGHGYHRAIASAAAAWNRLQLGVRFVPAGGESSVQIVFVRGRCLAGVGGKAPTGFQRFGSRVVVRACPAVVRPLLVAHELGRVLGLQNDDRTCSLMNSKGASDGRHYAVPAKCADLGAVPPWLPRLVDPRTAALARALYAAPAAPASVALEQTGPRIDWTQPARSGAVRTVVARSLGACPTALDVADDRATVVYDKPAFAGLHWALDPAVESGGGTYCYVVFNLSRSGRASASAPLGLHIDVPPTAAFTVATAGSAGAPTTFADGSTDSDGSIVEWRWGFGDPASGAANTLDTTDPAAGRAPAHTYAAAGSYSVTLTVVDDGGRSSTVSATIVVNG